jgi:hypothetical protein
MDVTRHRWRPQLAKHVPLRQNPQQPRLEPPETQSWQPKGCLSGGIVNECHVIQEAAAIRKARAAEAKVAAAARAAAAKAAAAAAAANPDGVGPPGLPGVATPAVPGTVRGVIRSSGKWGGPRA